MATTRMQSDHLWSLYAQTVVRFDYYPFEGYHESHQIVNFERDSTSTPPPLSDPKAD